MKLVGHFRPFLTETVNLDDARLKTLNDRVDIVAAFLETAPTIGDMFLGVTPQGSLAHRTIIKPLPDHEIDADILLELEPQGHWHPKDYVNETYTAFGSDGRFSSRVTAKNRCVRVKYASEMHIDVVPYVKFGDDGYIMNREDGENGASERTDPEGYSEWLDDRSRITGGNLIKVIRLMKWLRDYKETFTCRSVILNLLLAERVTAARLAADPAYYGDVPTTLVHLLEDLSAYLQPYDTYMPRIVDPTCPEVDYNHRWDNDQYLNFRSKLASYATRARAALNEHDRDRSVALWQDLFGDDFASAKTLTKSQQDEGSKSRDPGEQFIEDKYPVARRGYTVKIAAHAEKKPGFRHGPMARIGNRILRDRMIRFELAQCTVPEPYDVLWKIKNRGAEAIEAQCLRGEIIPGKAGSRTHREPTKYRGHHYVEAYIIKNGECVAVDRQPVIIV
jgi:hypothetical protein